jgi:hypothetical protein
VVWSFVVSAVEHLGWFSFLAVLFSFRLEKIQNISFKNGWVNLWIIWTNSLIMMQWWRLGYRVNVVITGPSTTARIYKVKKIKKRSLILQKVERHYSINETKVKVRIFVTHPFDQQAYHIGGISKTNENTKGETKIGHKHPTSKPWKKNITIKLINPLWL